MKIKSYMKEYEVIFEHGFRKLKNVQYLFNSFFIIDENVYRLFTTQMEEMIGNSPFYLVKAIETNKNIEEVLKIIDRMVDLNSKRNTNLISIGGGIVQDISGFIANILYRGIAWTWIPTTLLAQADSCIGSKTSLNYKNYKNILGYFYPPDRIYINSDFLRTLDRKDYLSGLGEIIKCALMDGYASFLETSGNLTKLLERDEKTILEEIQKALAFKKTVIEIDEFDKEYRNIMNYGHTFGHALESTSHYALPHGQAVSFGIMIANQISLNRGYITKDMSEEVQNVLDKVVMYELFDSRYFEKTIYLNTLKKDKKYTGITHTCILFEGNGVKRYSDITDSEIVSASKAIMNRNEGNTGENYYAEGI